MLRVVLESELRAVTNAEKAFGIALALVGGLTMALAFAEVAVIVAALCSDRTSYRDQLERLWEGGARLRLPSEIRARVFEEGVGRRTAEAGSESFAAVKIAIEGESAIVSIDTSPTARSSPAKQHATQPARSSPLAG